MQKWEYLEVVKYFKDGGMFGTARWIVGGINNSPLKKEELFYPYFIKLGEDGWELISVESNMFYFKRPKP